jgi:OOP family OmpA-OmpF porin
MLLKEPMKQLLLIGILSAASIAPLAVHAEGAYLGINAGSIELEASLVNQPRRDKTDAGYKLYGGYALDSNFGIETGYVDFGKIKGSSNNGPATVSASLETQAIYLAATGALPINDQFSLFAKAGVSLNHIEARVAINTFTERRRATQASALLGIGAAFNVTKNIAVVAEYEDFGKVVRADGVELKANMLSAGLRYKF